MSEIRNYDLYTKQTELAVFFEELGGRFTRFFVCNRYFSLPTNNSIVLSLLRGFSSTRIDRLILIGSCCLTLSSLFVIASDIDIHGIVIIGLSFI